MLWLRGVDVILGDLKVKNITADMSAESTQAMSCALAKDTRCSPLLASLKTAEIKESKTMLGLD